MVTAVKLLLHDYENENSDACTDQGDHVGRSKWFKDENKLKYMLKLKNNSI